MKKIIFAHLLNDYSGSPLVLSTAVRRFVDEGFHVELVTSSKRDGFLSKLEGVRYRYIDYHFHENKFRRTLALLRSQVAMFFKILANAKGETVVYVNTLLPFGAAMAGWLLRKKVVYHLHETTVNPPFLKTFLKKTAAFCASEAIYVSHFLQEQEPLPGVPSRVVYNCLPQDFVQKAEAHLSASHTKSERFTVLMLCSLKAYKGVAEYLRLAERLPELRFVLVLNTSYGSIQKHFEGKEMPDNLVVFPAQHDVHFFYQEAHLVLNLSHPEQWVETFGMTLLEAMSYGLPVIAPPVGGPVELVQDGYNGYRIDQRNLPALSERVHQILSTSELYQRLSANARAFAKRFSEQEFGGEVLKVAMR
ncbi:MAG: glycosyltransferase family 4 protein [Saprospiraceae bacterium]|nr:glycosyltransferase family 4 protein [Saprospiraceae bacterium]